MKIAPVAANSRNGRTRLVIPSPSAHRYQTFTIDDGLPVVQYSVAERRMADGRWQMANGKWQITADHRLLTTDHSIFNSLRVRTTRSRWPRRVSGWEPLRMVRPGGPCLSRRPRLPDRAHQRAGESWCR